MNISIKTGLIISTILLFISIITLQYNVFGTRTIIDVFIGSALLINILLLNKIFKNKKKTAE
jgi:NADH:ubiquinone oxidoreductase subunit K